MICLGCAAITGDEKKGTEGLVGFGGPRWAPSIFIVFFFFLSPRESWHNVAYSHFELIGCDTACMCNLSLGSPGTLYQFCRHGDVLALRWFYMNAKLSKLQ